MGINHIRLSTELIAVLYPETLVGEKDPDINIEPGLTQNKKVREPACRLP